MDCSVYYFVGLLCCRRRGQRSLTDQVIWVWGVWNDLSTSLKCPLLSSCLLPVQWHMQSGRETFNLPAKWSGPRQCARAWLLHWCCLGRRLLQRVEFRAMWVGAMSSLHTFTVTTAPSPSTWPSTHNRTFKLLTNVSLRPGLPSSSHCAYCCGRAVKQIPTASYSGEIRSYVL